jgi:CTP-dependent riboflavin kinase
MAEGAVLQRLETIAGFPLIPGTLNLRLPGPLERGPEWRYVAATEVGPDWTARTGQAGYFLVEVVIEDRLRGLAFQAVEPEGTGYPSDQIELFSEVHLRTELGLDDGDPLSVSVVASAHPA